MKVNDAIKVIDQNCLYHDFRPSEESPAEFAARIRAWAAELLNRRPHTLHAKVKAAALIARAQLIDPVAVDRALQSYRRVKLRGLSEKQA